MLELGNLLCVLVDLSVVLHSETLGIGLATLRQAGKCLLLTTCIGNDLCSRRGCWTVGFGHDHTDRDTFELFTSFLLQDDF